MSDKPGMMPVIQNGLNYEHCIDCVPFSWLSEHLIERYHHQNIDKMAFRGGMSPIEILKVLRIPIASPDLTGDLAALILTWIVLERMEK